MIDSTLLFFLAGAAIGSYFQTLTGFALGIFIMAFAIPLEVATVPETAVALNVMTICNASTALRTMWRAVDVPSAIQSIAGIIPSLLAGVALLALLHAHHTESLRVLVGILIILGGIWLLLRPRPRSIRQKPYSFVVAGVIAGFFGGLVGIAGPPMVYHFYRQPDSIRVIRATLLTIFFALAVIRLLFVGLVSPDDLRGMQQGLFAIPGVALGTWLCVRYPPRISGSALRFITFVTLVILGAMILVGEIGLDWVARLGKG
ncbi:MAG: sulfite exporter TauE/SafE family protein [Ectothiorhodospiraceae bacterium]|nr:sulfite exporter TauE/SafE family protein [Ectothiorhodospiraceae bacterium]